MIEAHSRMPVAEVQKLLRAKFVQTRGSLLDTTHRLHTGDMSPLEAVQQSLDRIEQENERLNCFVTVAREQAEERARSLEREIGSSERSLLWGVPISVKDLTPTEGLTTTFSSKAFADYVPEKDAPLVTAMKAAGTTIVGKTNTPEFGILPVTESELNGVCRNPWSLERSAGGSSGGAAASVAAGLTSVAHGSDGAGSLRIPASCCGVFAVVLPHGRLPAPARPTLGRGALEGVFSRTVADSLYYMLGMNAITAEELAMAVGDASTSSASITLTCKPPIDCVVDSACVAAAHRAAELLGASGCLISERELDWSDDCVLTDMMLLRSSTPVTYGDPPSELLDRTTRDALSISMRTSALEFHRAFVRLNTYAERILRSFREDEILLTPVLARPSVPHGWITERADPYDVFRRSAEFAPFTAFVNLAGLCAVSLPLSWSEDEMPIGIQLASRSNNLAQLLGMAARLERLAPWADRTPPIFCA